MSASVTFFAGALVAGDFGALRTAFASAITAAQSVSGARSTLIRGMIAATGATTVAIMHGVPDEHAGAASGLLQMDQQIGGALGIAVITSIYSLNSVPGHYAAGLPAAFGAGAGIALAAAGMAWGVVRGRSGEGWSG